MMTQPSWTRPGRFAGMKSPSRLAAFLAAALMLLAPAVWNGFPLLQYDTGGYFARWYEGHLEESRSTVYGLFLNVLARPDFWPAVTVQAALTVWVLWLVLRAHALALPAVLLTVVGALSLFTTLSWLASTLLTDIFTGLAVLALYLLALHADILSQRERWALIAFLAFAASTHTATLAVLMALLLAGLVLAFFNRRLLPFAGLGRGALALIFSAVLLLAANFAVAKRVAWTPGGSAIVFGRMMNAGIVARFLTDHCPDPRFRLCQYREGLTTNADYFFWGDKLFDRLGRFEGLGAEMSTIVRESLLAYPWLQLKAAAGATARQLVRVATGYGVHTEIWHTHWIIETYAPNAAAAMKSARQQKEELDFTAINRVHLPVAWASMLLLAALIAIGPVRRHFTDVLPLAATAALAIFANAAICGALSNPNDRYGARIVWLAPLVMLLVPFRRRPAPEHATPGT
jgi:hypothetical protein